MTAYRGLFYLALLRLDAEYNRQIKQTLLFKKDIDSIKKCLQLIDKSWYTNSSQQEMNIII